MAARRLLAAAVLALLACSVAHAANDVIVLCYHEVESDRATVLSRTAVRAGELAAQFAWLQDSGYVAVSLQQVLDSRQGGKPLPAKAVLLTFDDGKQDVYTRVFPLLRLFRYPAVVALAGSWLDVAADGTVDYDGTPVPRGEFVSWDEVREMQRSGLVEIASHSYDLHRGLLANPQGNTEPAAISRIYQEGQYETDAIYLERLRADLTASRNQIARETGVSPRTIVWPYGRSNRAAQEIAAGLGMVVGFVLASGFNTEQTPLATLERYLIAGSAADSLQEHVEALRRVWSPDPARSVRIEPAQWAVVEDGLSRALDEILRLEVNITFVDPRAARGQPETVLFPTSRRTAGPDALNRIAWQISQRSGSPVFIDLPSAWLDDPELLADLARQVNFAGIRVAAAPGDKSVERALEIIHRWCWPVQVAYAPGKALPADAWLKLRDGDLVVLPATADMFAAVDARNAGHVLFEFDPATTPAAGIAKTMRRLEADGFRQFGIAALPDTGLEVIAPALSLRSLPLQP